MACTTFLLNGAGAALLLLLLLLVSHHTPGAEAAVEDVCKTIKDNYSSLIDYDFCVRSLQADPASGAADTKGQAVIAASMSQGKAAATANKIQGLIAGSKDGKETQVLRVCLDIYSNKLAAVLDKLTGLIQQNKFAEAKPLLAGEAELPGNCEDSLKQAGVASPLSQENDEEGKLILIAFAITDLLG